LIPGGIKLNLLKQKRRAGKKGKKGPPIKEKEG